MQRSILAVVVELLRALNLQTIEEFSPDRDMSVRNALAWVFALATLAYRQIQGHETTLKTLERETQIPRRTLDRYLKRMGRAGLVHAEGPRYHQKYYVDLSRFDTPELRAHLTAKVAHIIRAANRITKIQRSGLSVA